jgi:hypothetical protein
MVTYSKLSVVFHHFFLLREILMLDAFDMAQDLLHFEIRTPHRFATLSFNSCPETVILSLVSIVAGLISCRKIQHSRQGMKE